MRTSLALFVLLLGAAAGCSSSSSSTPAGAAVGAEGGACYGNGSCNAGLSCLSQLCVSASHDGGGTDGGTTPTDGSMAADTSAPVDSSTMSDAPHATLIGAPCTGSGQGTCDTGYECMQFQGGTGPWCTRVCQTSSDTCNTGYTGPGLASCTMSVANGGTTTYYCAVLCEDDEDGGTGCGAKCTGACPGTLACTNVIPNVAKFCQ